MIEIWTCGEPGVGEVGAGFTARTAARLAMNQAFYNGTLRREILDPEQTIDLTPPGDTTPQWVTVHNNDSATICEAAPDESDDAPTKMAIGRGGLPCVPVCREEEPDDPQALRMRLFWLVAHVESTPEYEDLRSLLQRRP